MFSTVASSCCFVPASFLLQVLKITSESIRSFWLQDLRAPLFSLDNVIPLNLYLSRHSRPSLMCYLWQTVVWSSDPIRCKRC